MIRTPWSQPCGAVAIALMVSVFATAAPPAFDVTALTAGPLLESSTGFGDLMATDGTRLAVAVPYSAVGHESYIIIYERDSGRRWVESSRAVAPPNTTWQSALAIDGDSLAVTVRSNEVLLYRFNGSNWVSDGLLIADSGDWNENFGVTLALDGDVLAVGATYDAELASYAGSVYIFRRVAGSWLRETKLFAPDGDINDQFGEALAIEGDRLVVGTPRFESWEGHYHEIGSVYSFIYDRSARTWRFEQQLLPPDELDVDQAFGYALALEGNSLAISRPLANDRLGSVEIYSRQTGAWVHHAHVAPGVDATAKDYYGRALDLSNDRLAVGAVDFNDRGGVYLYRRNSDQSWSEEDRLMSPASQVVQFFGDEVHWADSGHLLVAAPMQDAVYANDQAGVVHEFAESTSPALALFSLDQAHVYDRFELDAALIEPGTKVIAFGSRQTGQTTVPECPGQILSLRNPIRIGQSIADTFGNARIAFRMPGLQEGRFIYFQVVGTDCRVSNVRAVEVTRN